MAENVTVRAEDVLPVRSRISWGAILGGTMVAVALYVLLGLLGVAAGFSVSPHTTDRQLTVGAAIWAVFSILVALFVGGWSISQLTAGESRCEAAFYGLVM